VITVAVIFAMEGGGPILVPFAVGLRSTSWPAP
jgi:hypothetical protein